MDEPRKTRRTLEDLRGEMALVTQIDDFTLRVANDTRASRADRRKVSLASEDEYSYPPLFALFVYLCLRFALPALILAVAIVGLFLLF